MLAIKAWIVTFIACATIGILSFLAGRLIERVIKWVDVRLYSGAMTCSQERDWRLNLHTIILIPTIVAIMFALGEAGVRMAGDR
jgi:hypothetical protein